MFLALLIFCASPTCDVVEESVDLVEINHVYDSDHNYMCTQVIWWRWCDSKTGREIVDWRYLEQCRMPVRTNRGFECVWIDSIYDDECDWRRREYLRRVVAVQKIVTHTAYDRERYDATKFPAVERALLVRP